MSYLMLDDDLADDLVRAFQRSGYTTDEIKRICESDILVEFRKVLLGHASIVAIEHIIDLDADPFVPEGWKAEEHQKGGQFNWDASKVSLYLSDAQKSGKCIEGNKLREELAGKPVLNANVLDYLLANPHLLPRSGKKSTSSSGGPFTAIWTEASASVACAGPTLNGGGATFGLSATCITTDPLRYARWNQELSSPAGGQFQARRASGGVTVP